jgi:hypothetical protein
MGQQSHMLVSSQNQAGCTQYPALRALRALLMRRLHLLGHHQAVEEDQMGAAGPQENRQQHLEAGATAQGDLGTAALVQEAAMPLTNPQSLLLLLYLTPPPMALRVAAVKMLEYFLEYAPMVLPLR